MDMHGEACSGVFEAAAAAVRRARPQVPRWVLYGLPSEDSRDPEGTTKW